LLTGLVIDEMIARYSEEGGRVYLTDALGSVVAQLRADQSLVNTYAYSPYGESRQSGDDEGNSSEYTGREDDGTTVYYYRSRYYDSVLKHFIAEDSIGLIGGINVYAYVEANPVTRSDPTGECPWCIGAAIGAIVEVTAQLINTGGKWRCLDIEDVLLAGATGALGGGLGGLTRLKAAGKEFSHWIPDRYIRPRSLSGKNPNKYYKSWLDNPIGRWFVHSKLNGNYLSPIEHWKNDGWRQLARKSVTGLERNLPWRQQINRAPGWAAGTAAGVGVGQTGTALTPDGDCGC
jgi:RHS repeat-associated protein